jgi:hypothetical protein
MVMAIGDLISVNVEFANGRENAMNVIGYEVSEMTETDENVFIQALVDEVVIEAHEAVLNLMGGGTTLVCATGRRVLPGAPTRVFTAFGTGEPSINPVAPSGAQMAILLSKYAPAGSEPKQGRLYLPFPAKDLSDDGQIKDAEQTLIRSETDPWILDPLILSAVGTVLPAIIKLIPGFDSVASLVEQIVLRPVLATQRRRVVPHQNFGA